MELSGVSSDKSIPKEPPKKENLDPRQNINTLLQRQAKFLESCREVKTVSYLNALSQLCHTSTDLGHASWVDSFPRIWKILSDKQQQMLGGELIPFMCSGNHVIQKDCHPSSIHTFLEGLSHCVPPVHIRPCVLKVELSCPKEMAWKVNLYRGYIAICQPDDHHLNTVTMIERLVEVSSNLAIKEWRRLPSIVSHIHVPLLQAAQQIMELQEAAQINQGLQPANITRSSSLHDMKAIVKTWRNRLPMISDDLSHWSDIFTWRQHHYQFIVDHYDNHSQQDPVSV
ncbi:transformation/transcription domain-associated protein-like [Pecten maximus]|uniref:transformation/transcription domain-associated protein-like n=1 Tax=Pecten maximus TaxID=6579 RepID=UPI0014588C89|nr:transformation/transcription domain-associated protein-like [Pecten maximus]